MPSLYRFTPPLAVSFAITTSLAICFSATILVVSIVPEMASAQGQSDADDLQSKRTTWQGRYRALLSDRARFTNSIAVSEKNYAQAQRRNYPRGGAREKFLADAKEAKERLAVTEDRIVELFADARDDGVPPGWLYEVEDETFTVPQPAAAGSAGGDPAETEDREGRNPVYFRDDEAGDVP